MKYQQKPDITNTNITNSRLYLDITIIPQLYLDKTITPRYNDIIYIDYRVTYELFEANM